MAAFGIRPENLILDPGFGFGKTQNHTSELFRALPRIRALGFPVLVGLSRKSFIGMVTGAPVEDRLPGSLAAALAASAAGVPMSADLASGPGPERKPAEARDRIPFWGDWVGSLTVGFDRLRAGNRDFVDVGGTFVADPRSLRLQYGRAVIPLMAAAGCNVPAIMGTRVLATKRERTIACALITLIPCSARTAVILVNGYNGLGLHTVLQIPRMFGDTFRNFIFVQVGAVDAGNFKGADEIEALRAHTEEGAGRYVAWARAHGYGSASFTTVSADVMGEVMRLSREAAGRFPNHIFFAGQLLFRNETRVTRWLHNHTALALQRRFFLANLPFVVLPIRVG